MTRQMKKQGDIIMEHYNPDVDDDYGRRRFNEKDYYRRDTREEGHVCEGSYQMWGKPGQYFVPKPRQDIVKRYREWSKDFTRLCSRGIDRWKGKKEVWGQEPYLVFFDYTHDIFAIYYGIEGYCYSFAKNRCDDKEKLLGWIRHLAMKRWFSRKHLHDLIKVWEDVFAQSVDKWR